MNGILRKIVDYKIIEIKRQKEQVNIDQLLAHKLFKRAPLSLEHAINEGSGIIAEFKRASPSKGVIRKNADVKSITSGYEKAGASAISVLTDQEFFRANEHDLPLARQSVNIPILRKEFIIDEYQIYQAKTLGADAILLIAAILTKDKMRSLLTLTHNLGLEAIIEVHNQEELDKLCGDERIIGVNNRNLDTFDVDIATSIDLSSQLRAVVKVTESGLNLDTDIASLIEAGFNGFLIGESFMKSEIPEDSCREFVELINTARR